MTRSKRLSILVRILLPLLFIPMLGISAQFRDLANTLFSSREAIENRRYGSASVGIARAAQYLPWRMDLWEQAGILAQESGDNLAAQTYLRRVADSNELSKNGYVALGDAENMLGDQESAIKYWEAALRMDVDDFEIHSRLAKIFNQLGKIDAQIIHQKALVEINPTDPALNYELGLLLAASQPESALAYLSLASESDASFATSALSLFRDIRSARFAEDQSYLLANSGQSLASIGEWDLAEIALSKSTKLNPEFADAWAYLGEARQQMGNGGLEELQHALEIDPDSVIANTLMGIYWQRQGDFGLALIYLYGAARLDPDNPAIQVEIGNTLANLGNLSSAENHYQRAADMSPRDAQYWRSLANFYIRYEMKLRGEGLAAARQAVLLNPESADSLDLLAQIYLLLDSPYLARRFLQRALAIDPYYPPALVHIGLVNIDEGDKVSAYQHFKLAQEHTQQDSALGEQIRRLLETYFP